MSRRRAIDARITWDGNAYAIQEWQVSAVSNLLDMSNTEGIPTFDVATPELGTSSVLPDVPKARITLRNMTFDDAANPFAGPTPIYIGACKFVNIYPAGLTSDAGAWIIPLCVGQVDHGGRVPGAQPVTVHGENDGLFLPPTGGTF
jgi:hypothetical protein